MPSENAAVWLLTDEKLTQKVPPKPYISRLPKNYD